jgi:hypothetical protein
MKAGLCAIAVMTMGVTGWIPQSAPAAFDPVGKWTVSTVSDEGRPMSVTVDITGRPGAYTGQAATGERILPLRNLATTPSGMIAIFDLPQGAIVVSVARDAGGKHAGAWGEVSATYALTAERGR